MKSINELRKICQNTRPSIWTDFQNKFYYQISIYFTYIFIIFRLKANHVTLFSGMVAIIGGILIISENKSLTLIGFLLFHLFAILDMCDGEVARYNKESSINGHFLDWFMHYITSFAMLSGLFIYSISFLDNNVLIFTGLIAICIPLFDKSITSSGWTVIVWTRLRKFNDKNKIISKKKHTKQTSSLIKKRLFFLLIHPFMEHWIKLSLLVLSLIDLILEQFNLNFLNYKVLILQYIGILGPIYIIVKIKNLFKKNSLNDGYNRLFISKRKPKLPNDDFL